MDKLEDGLTGELRNSAWYDPTSRRIYQGRVGETQALLMNLANPKQAQLFSIADISAVNIPILLQEILGLQRPVYNLRNVCRVINMNELKATIPIFTKPTSAREGPTANGGFTRSSRMDQLNLLALEERHPHRHLR